jgi:hypothetical protein
MEFSAPRAPHRIAERRRIPAIAAPIVAVAGPEVTSGGEWIPSADLGDVAPLAHPAIREPVAPGRPDEPRSER